MALELKMKINGFLIFCARFRIVQMERSLAGTMHEKAGLIMKTNKTVLRMLMEVTAVQSVPSAGGKRFICVTKT
jgi:hypothetical protein